MGTDVRVEFEAKCDGKWIEVGCDYFFERDYLFFAWLADQRNDFGVLPIGKHRGLPKDYSHDPEYGPGEHSQSWLTADELLSAPEQVITLHGCIAQKDFDKWNGASRPDADIFGTDMSGRPGMVDVSWKTELREEYADFLAAVSTLRNEYGEVRMIFGFES